MNENHLTPDGCVCQREYPSPVTRFLLSWSIGPIQFWWYVMDALQVEHDHDDEKGSGHVYPHLGEREL